MPLIGQNNTLELVAVILAVVASGEWLERTAIGRYVSSTVWVIVAALVLANIGVIPHGAPVYDMATNILVPLGIPLLLLKADIRTILREGGRTVIAFGFGTVGTLLGLAVALRFVDLGTAMPKLAGMFAATYIGGSMNLVAVAQSTKLDNPTLLSASFAADNVVSALYLVILGAAVAAPPIIRFFKRRSVAATPDSAGPDRGQPAPDRKPVLDMLHITGGLALSAAICGVSVVISRLAHIENYTILIITALTVAIANLAPKALSRLSGEAMIGLLFFQLFFFAIGAAADVGVLANSAMTLLWFAAIIVTVHLLVIALSGRLFGLSAEEIAIGSNAAVLGPTTAAAMAAAQGWDELVTPGVLTGILGYVIANFIGTGLFFFLGG